MWDAEIQSGTPDRAYAINKKPTFVPPFPSVLVDLPILTEKRHDTFNNPAGSQTKLLLRLYLGCGDGELLPFWTEFMVEREAYGQASCFHVPDVPRADSYSCTLH